jgi:Zn-finger protein
VSISFWYAWLENSVKNCHLTHIQEQWHLILHDILEEYHKIITHITGAIFEPNGIGRPRKA